MHKSEILPQLYSVIDLVNEHFDKTIMKKTQTFTTRNDTFSVIASTIMSLKYLMRAREFVYTGQEKFEKKVLF